MYRCFVLKHRSDVALLFSGSGSGSAVKGIVKVHGDSRGRVFIPIQVRVGFRLVGDEQIAIALQYRNSI